MKLLGTTSREGIRLWTSKKPDPDAQPTGGRAPSRQEKREAAAQNAREASRRRSVRRLSVTLSDRVARASKKLGGQNVAQAVKTVELAAPTDRDIFLLAEEFGQNRRAVLRAFGPVRRDVRDAYIREVGLPASASPVEETGGSSAPTADDKE